MRQKSAKTLARAMPPRWHNIAASMVLANMTFEEAGLQVNEVTGKPLYSESYIKSQAYVSIKQDISPLRTAEDESRKLLLSLIEMVNRNPETETYTMLGYCYGSNLGNQLTQLLESEKITPIEGIEEEFHQILDSILSDIVKKLELLQLKARLKSTIDGADTAPDKPKEES